MSSLFNVIIAVLGLGFLILVHELGHFMAAKAFGMRVEEFSLGFGRYLVSRRRGETVYGISAVPLGGYVRVTGMHEEDFQARVKAVEDRDKGLPVTDFEARLTGSAALTDEEIVRTPLNRRYYAHPLWQRLIFIVSGVSMNVVAAFFLLLVVGMQGLPEVETVIREVQEGSPAAAAGLQPGDRLVVVGGESVTDWQMVQDTIRAHPNEELALVVERNGTEVALMPTVGEREDGAGQLGVLPEVQTVSPGFVESVRFAADRTLAIFALIFTGLRDMVTGAEPVTGDRGISGPIGIVSVSNEALEQGFFLSLLAFISINLAILNMLPLLPLDGGHLAFGLMEKILGRTISLRTFERVSMVGISLFLLLTLVATGNDIGRLFSGGVLE
jgi:regulator of sigma E protease